MQSTANERRVGGDRTLVSAPETRVLAAIGEPPNGVGYVRFLQPFRHLARDGFRLATLGESITLCRGPKGWEPSPTLLDGAAMLVFPQMVAAPDLADGSRLLVARPLCREARRRGIPIVYSVDDSLHHLDSGNPAYESMLASRDNLDAIREFADALIVTTEPLRDSLAGWDLPTFVIPNAVDPDDWQERPRSSDELRVGWTGSSSHLEDLLFLLPAIREVQRRVPFRFVLQGLVDLPLDEQMRQIRSRRKGMTAAQRLRADRFRHVLRSLREIDHVHVPFADTRAFFGILPGLDLDVGLCPLLDGEFNRHKSANKFYEYAVTGSLTIASDVVPYTDEVSIVAPNETGAWSDCLERWLLDPEAREAELARQRAFMMSERTIDVWRGPWAEALGSIIDRGAAAAVRNQRGERA